MIAAFAVAATMSPAVAADSSALSAVFARTSYRPGALARLIVTTSARTVEVELVDAAAPPTAREAAAGAADLPATPPTVTLPVAHDAVFVRVGDWPSGVYFFRVRAAGATTYAPLVVRARKLGSAPVAVIVPTYSWQAYNFTDGDSWYACACVHTIDLTRPYARKGIPSHFNGYERGFLRWLRSRHKDVEFLTDQDLERFTSGDQLRRAYRLLVFSGHEEYVTAHEFDLVQGYRDRGGHLIFLSADNFFREVSINRGAMTLIGRWRDLGRPEASLIGSQYLDWNHSTYPNRPYRVVGAHELPWLFRDTGLHDGSLINGDFGIEIDATTTASPPHTIVVAEVPHIFGYETAQMTYYRTRRGAEVFAAGTMNLGGSAELPAVSALLTNLWQHMA